MSDLTERTMEDLQARKAILDLVLRALRNEAGDGCVAALAEYERQAGVIEAELTRRNGRPPDVVIGLNPLQIAGNLPAGG